MVYVIILITALAFLNASGILGQNSEVGLMRIMARSNDLLQQDPARYMSCFQEYIERINDIANNYETNYKACLETSMTACAKVDEATYEKRYELVNSVKASCALMKVCPEHDSVEEILQCYVDGGYTNIQTMYDVHVNASEELALLREQYFLIKNEQYKCTNETKRNYEKASADKYVSFNDCILGNSGIIDDQISSSSLRSIFNDPLYKYKTYDISFKTSTSKEIASAEIPSEETTSEEIASEATTSEEIASEENSSEENASEEIASEESTSDEISSESPTQAE